VPVTTTRSHVRERGQVVVIFALLLPMFLALGGVVIGIGNWYVHAKNLQTKADAGALGGGDAWSFPCGANTDSTIINQARLYAGPSTAPPATSPGLNPQVGKVSATKIHTVLNGSDYYDDDGNPAPSEFNDPPSSGSNGALCDAKILDVKMTEDNSFPLASLIPLFPDIKRRARVEIQESAGSSGLLPIAVRVPKPVSAAAIFVDETQANFGAVLAARPFNDNCEPPNFSDCITGTSPIPSGLDQFITEGAVLPGGDGNMTNGFATINGMPSQVGVVIALSFRKLCGVGSPPCLDLSYTNINSLCNQGNGVAQCYYAPAPSNGNQVFASGLQFIRGYQDASFPTPPPPATAAPALESVWLGGASGTNCFEGGYFSAPVANSCAAILHAAVDAGGRPANQVEVKYKLVYGNTTDVGAGSGSCGGNFGVNCDVAGGVAPVTFVPGYARHAFSIRVRLKQPAVFGTGAGQIACNATGTNCEWFFTGEGVSQNANWASDANTFAHPVQRGFMGNIDRSGPVKFLHLYNVQCSGSSSPIAGAIETGDAASVLSGQTQCFQVEMGLQGALARDQDEYPIQLNVGATSQSSVVDCDPNLSNLKDEIQQGCGTGGFPTYAKHTFVNQPYCPNVSSAAQFFSLPKPFPWDDWGTPTASRIRCVLTQTSAAPNQVAQGFNLRFFGVSNNPSCPADNAEFVRGRNYWHDYNNDFTADPDGSGTNGGPEPSQPDYYTFATSHGLPARDPTFLPHGNHLRNDDPRLVLLFITPYNSFTGNGNETYPISLIGGFYITGYGTINGAGNLTIEDPFSDGASASPYAGNNPPPDLDTSTSGAVAWGHFINPVDLGSSAGGNGALCQPSTPTTCVPVLVR